MIAVFFATAWGSFDAGLQAFDAGRYEAAVFLWSRELDAHPDDAHLATNVALAHLELDEPERALALLRRAQRYAPRLQEVSRAIHRARSNLDGALPPVGGPTGIWSAVTPMEAAQACLVTCVIGVGGAMTMRRRRRSTGAFVAVWAVGSVGLAGSLWTDRMVEAHPVAVVSDGNMAARDAANPLASRLFRLPKGSEVRVIEERGAFVRVVDGQQASGWVPDKGLNRAW